MIRIAILCEGQTEEAFVNDLLSEALLPHDILLNAALIGKPGQKGGHIEEQRMLRDLKNLLNDKTSYCATFFDFYGTDSDFPGKREAKLKSSIREKRDCVCEKLKEKVIAALGDHIARRFIPYVQMYEFEGLLFTSPEIMADTIGEESTSKSLLDELLKIRKQFETPEHINNNPETAPSKRIKKLCGGRYNKVTQGTIISNKIGVSTIAQECKLFGEWIETLKSLPSLTP